MMNASEQKNVVDARWNFNGNIKVGNIATWSTLPSDRVFVSEVFGEVKGTCPPECCEHCGKAKEGKVLPPCYVFKSHRFPSVIDGQARNTLSIRNNPELACEQLSGYLKRKKNPVVAARFDQSGEGENKRQFRGFASIAIDNENLPFYIYSKQFEILVEMLLNGEFPKNFTVLFSIWHEQGIKEYLKVAHLPNIKAFVYCDKNSDPINGWGVEEYEEHGIIIQTFCKAYGMDGKMNHDVTCDICKKCFNRSKNAKVVGCWDH